MRVHERWMDRLWWLEVRALAAVQVDHAAAMKRFRAGRRAELESEAARRARSRLRDMGLRSMRHGGTR